VDLRDNKSAHDAGKEERLDMAFGWMLLAVVVGAFLAVLLALAGFWLAVVRPYLDQKVSEVIEAAETIEPAVKRGVREGVEETLREFPETSLKESTRQVRKFGSGLFENGLSSFWADGPGSTRKKADD
jgi:hypothetical protein